MMSASLKNHMAAPLGSSPRTGTMTLPNAFPVVSIDSDQEGKTSSNKREKNSSPFAKNDDMGEEAGKKTVPVNGEDALHSNKRKRKRHYKRLRKMKYKNDHHRHQKRHSGGHRMNKRSNKVSRNCTRKRFKTNNNTNQSLTLSANIHMSNTQAPEDVQVNQSVAISPSKPPHQRDKLVNSPNFVNFENKNNSSFEKFSPQIFKPVATPACYEQNKPPFFAEVTNSFPTASPVTNSVTRIWHPEKKITHPLPTVSRIWIPTAKHIRRGTLSPITEEPDSPTPSLRVFPPSPSDMLTTPSPTLFDDTDDEEEYVIDGIPFPTDYNVYSTVNDKPDTTSNNTPIIQHAYPATIEETAQLNKIIDATQEIKNVVSVDEEEKEEETKEENEANLVHDPQEAYDRLYPPSPPPYDLSNKAADLKKDEEILDSDFLSELDFVFDHLAPDIEPLEALWKYELNDDMPENIFSPVTSMYGVEAKNKLRKLLFDFHEKASDLLAHEFAAVPMITGMYPKRRQVIYDDDGFVIDYNVRKIIETMYPPIDGPPWPYKLSEAYAIPHYKSEIEYWTERPLTEDFFVGVIRPCYYAARAEQDGDSDANADLQFQRRCNDYIIYELLWVVRGQITAIQMLLNNFQLLHEWEARRNNDHDFNMWQNFVDLCDDDHEETIDKAIVKARKGVYHCQMKMTI